MDITGLVSVFLIIILIIFSLKRTVYGFCVFLCARILIPESVRLPIADISVNSALILLLLIMVLINSCLNGRKLRYNKNLFLGLGILILYSFLSILISNHGNLSYQLNYLLQFTLTDLTPMIIAAIVIREKKDIQIVVNAFLVSTIITCSYGIVSYLMQSNPYLMLFSGKDWNSSEYWYGNFTTATFVSTNSFGYFISLSVPFVVFLHEKGYLNRNNKIVIPLLLVSAFLCKKRTTIIVLLAYGVMWFVSGNFKKRIKYVIYSIPVMFAALFLIFLTPSLANIKEFIITSVFFWNDEIFNKVATVSRGSTMALRISQTLYPFIEIKSNILFGHGLGWCSWYLTQGHIHPVLFGFESLFSQAVCEFGLLAFLLYPMIFRKLYTFAQNKSKDKNILLFIISSVILMIGTGAAYWYLELIFVVIMRAINSNSTKEVRVYDSQNIYNIASL